MTLRTAIHAVVFLCGLCAYFGLTGCITIEKFVVYEKHPTTSQRVDDDDMNAFVDDALNKARSR